MFMIENNGNSAGKLMPQARHHLQANNKGLATAAGFFFSQRSHDSGKKNGQKNCSFKVFYRSVILYLAKLQYFTNLDLPEISGFPSSATNLEVV